MASSGKPMLKDGKHNDDIEVPIKDTDSDGVAVSDKDDLETHRSDSTRLSSSRSSATKSTGRKKKRLERFLAFNAKKAAESGETFEIVDIAERKEQQRAAMLQAMTASSSTTVAIRGSVLDSLTNEQKFGRIIDTANAKQLTREEKMAHKRMVDAFFTGVFVIEPHTSKSISDVNLRSLHYRDGNMYCRMCSKWANKEHMSGSEHRSRISELAACDEMIGPATSFRRFDISPGFRGPLSKASIRNYWGQDIENMGPFFATG